LQRFQIVQIEGERWRPLLPKELGKICWQSVRQVLQGGLLGHLPVDRRDHAVPAIAVPGFELRRELAQQRPHGIGIGLHLRTPEVEDVSALSLVEPQRLAAERALADPAEPLDHVDDPAVPQVAPERVQLLSPGDEALAQEPRPLPYLVDLACRRRLGRFGELALDGGAERVVRASLVEHQLRPGEGIALRARGCFGVAQDRAMGRLERPRHLCPGGAERIARAAPLADLAVERPLGPGREDVVDRPEIGHHLGHALAVQRGRRRRQSLARRMPGSSQDRRVPAMAAG
jgi:hypothetical protein